MDSLEPVKLPIDGVLDLHTFNPGEIKKLIPDYLSACREQGILQVRIIHGKGTGTLRRTVHSVLKRIQWVHLFKLAGEDAGGWGATIVELKATRQKKKKNDELQITNDEGKAKEAKTGNGQQPIRGTKQQRHKETEAYSDKGHEGIKP